MTEDDLSADQRAALAQLAKSALIESAATEVVSIGRALFKDGEPSDPKLQRRYRLYRRLEAALALPGSAWRRCIRRTANSEQIRRAPLLPSDLLTPATPAPAVGRKNRSRTSLCGLLINVMKASEHRYRDHLSSLGASMRRAC